MNARKNNIGKQYSRLTVINIEYRKGHAFYICKCVCGKSKTISYSNLHSQSIKSCGCLQKQLLALRSKKLKDHAIKQSIWNYYKRNAKNRNIKWELNQLEFNNLILNSCHYCGHIGRTITNSHYGDTLVHNGVDRINSKRQYTITNCVTACKYCNFAKSNMTEIEFKLFIKELYEHLFLK